MADDDRGIRLKIRLLGVSPMVWRRVEVSVSTPLQELHGVIQVAMGWEGHHLFEFLRQGRRFGSPILGFGDAGVSIGSLCLNERERFRYIYDMGDYWEHEVRVETFFDMDPKVRYPRCIGGARACPPEDCGGPAGYAALLEEATGADAFFDEEDAFETLADLGEARELDADEFRASLMDVIPVLERVANRASLLNERFDRRAANASLARGLHLELGGFS